MHRYTAHCVHHSCINLTFAVNIKLENAIKLGGININSNLLNMPTAIRQVQMKRLLLINDTSLIKSVCYISYL